MKVETYEIEDASSEASAMANDSEAIELINKLGLTGQKTIMNPDTVTRIPYRVMEDIEYKVYKTICPQSSKLEDYRNDTIPLRVLQVAAHAKDTELFNRLEVWYPKAAVIDDPVLIGVKRVEHAESWRNHDAFYMLARWGKTLETFERLIQIAVGLIKTQRIATAEKSIRDAQANLAVAKSSNDFETLYVLSNF